MSLNFSQKINDKLKYEEFQAITYKQKGNSNILINLKIKTNIIWMGEFL